MDSRNKALPPLIHLGQTHFSQKKRFLFTLAPKPMDSVKPERTIDEIRENTLHLTLQEKLLLESALDGERELMTAYMMQYDNCIEQPNHGEPSELESLRRQIEEVQADRLDSKKRLSALNSNPELNAYEKSSSSFSKAYQAAKARLRECELPDWLSRDNTPHPLRSQLSALQANSCFKTPKRKAVQLQPLPALGVNALPVSKSSSSLFCEARKSVASGESPIVLTRKQKR